MRPARNSLWLLVPVLLFSILTFLFQEPLIKGLAYTFSLLALFLFVVSYLGSRWPEYSFADYIRNAIFFIAELFVGAPLFATQIRKEQKESVSGRKKNYIWAVFRGILIALPFIILFSALFSSADLVFEQKLSDFLDKFELDDIGEYISRLLLILICAYFLAGSILYSASKSNDEKLRREGKRLVKPFLGITESSVVLGSVTILFAIFVGIQFRYFFGGEANIGVEG